ncbi:hypothetical protein J7297_02013 [Nakaseomyces glabratus]|nr:hypothetical protein J7297_02013 [Nakaseomyces glabratus]KAH7593475.1 hypothetical protein J7296_02015 [Nakaseomyces glabratus]KAI8386752.1 hypothetical protein J6894_02009 [Nakaseomyces glabratus]KTB23327.1 Oxidation resistance protein 1 [Nakaseomyces glabratus]KTB24455.1 Oxidation resistance protein 1 [Nakaseomyces glabratus]
MFNVKGALNRLRTTWSNSEESDRDPRHLKSSDDLSNYTGSRMSYEETLPPVTLLGYSPKTKNRLLHPEMCDELRPLMPTRIQLYTEWTLLYSLEQHGASLHSLYDKLREDASTPRRVGYVLVIKDRKDGIFGAYSNEPFHPHEHMRYSGNGECFLWKMESVPNKILRAKIREDKDEDLIDVNDDEDKINNSRTVNESWKLCAYPYTGANDFMIYCTSKFLSLGAGEGHYGLWCDDGLMKGVTNPTQTYGNDVLSREGRKFTIMGLEVWRVG